MLPVATEFSPSHRVNFWVRCASGNVLHQNPQIQDCKKACSFRIVYSRLNLFTQCDKYQVWSKVSKIQASKSKREQKLCQSDLWHCRLQYWALLHEHESRVGALHTLHKPASPISSNQYRHLVITAFNFGLGGDWKGCVGVPVERIGEGRSAARWSQMMEHWNCQCGPM